MKVGIRSDIQTCIFFLYSVRGNIQSAHWFSDWDMSKCCLSAPCHLLPKSHRLTQAMAVTPGQEVHQSECVTDLTRPSQREVVKAWQAWVTCPAMRLSEPAVEGKQVSSAPYFVFLCQLHFSLPVPRGDRPVMPLLLDSSHPIQCAKSEM